jgi:hypothetical protein
MVAAMIDRAGNEISLICDSTGRRYPHSYESCEFHQMLSDAKGDGWHIVQESGEWKHFSPESTKATTEFDIIDI